MQRAGPLPSLKPTSALTEPSRGSPGNADHCVPFHLATALAGMLPPTCVKPPPTYRAAPVPSLKTVKALTTLLTPPPTVTQAEPFHMEQNPWLPKGVTSPPPAYRCGPVPSL